MKRILQIISIVFILYSLLVAIYGALPVDIQNKIPLDEITTYVSGVITLIGGSAGLTALSIFNRVENKNDNKITELISFVNDLTKKIDDNNGKQELTQKGLNELTKLVEAELKIKRDSKFITNAQKEIIGRVLDE